MQPRIKETLAGSQPVGAGRELSSTGIRIELLRLAGDLARAPRASRARASPTTPPSTSKPRVSMHTPGERSAAAYLQAHWVRDHAIRTTST